MGMRINRLVSVFGFAVCLCAASLGGDALAASGTPLPLSDMRVEILSQGKRATFRLYDTVAAGELYAQLPLETDVEDYGGKEKIYYPPKKLNTADTPMVKAARPGTLAYYAPWGDVVMFYGSFGSAPGLYELGHAVQGAELIGSLSGSVRIE